MTNQSSSDGMSNESGRLDSSSDLRFPHPTERSGSVVIVFDGMCRLCTAQIRWLHRFDFRRRLSFISLHDPLVATWWPNLTYEMLMEQVYVIPPARLDNGQPASVNESMQSRSLFLPGVVGARYAMWRIPLLWPVASLLSVPFSQPVWRMLYRMVARNRYRFGKLGTDCGPDGTCHLHYGSEKTSPEH